MSVLRLASVLMVLLCIVGCAQSSGTTPNAEGPNGVFKRAMMHDLEIDRYTIDPPDAILLKCPGVKQLDGQKAVVGADGTVQFSPIGEVKVAGLTPGKVQQAIRQAASKWDEAPDIKVEIIAASKFFQIIRGDKRAKVVYTGNDSVVRALTETALDEGAWPVEVVLTRNNPDGSLLARVVIDFKKMCETGSMAQNYLLEPNDIVDIHNGLMPSFNFKSTQVLSAAPSSMPTSAPAVRPAP